MVKFALLDNLPDGRLEGGINLSERFGWSLHVQTTGKVWQVLAGDLKVLESDSQELVDAFLYGMGLAYSVFPNPILEDTVAALNDWYDD